MSPGAAQFRDETGADGSFRRQPSAFRHRVTADGASGFQAAPRRYHLYVSLACPWAHRAIIVRVLKGLENVIGLTVVDPIRDERGWAFCEPDPVNGFSYLSEAYKASDPRFTGRVTVPVLWHIGRGAIVNNESAEIIRDLNRAFDAWGRSDIDLYPQDLAATIDAVNQRVYARINNGVYRAGFATSQTAYEEAVTGLFEALEELEERLGRQRYLAGDRITEADWRLFTTLVRFDAVYVGHFKCNRRRLVDFPRLWAYTRELYQVPGIAATVNFDHIKRHYYKTHDKLNPSRIVPAGPELDFLEPHRRG